MDEWEVFINQAVAVGEKAIEQGIARNELTSKELEESARSKIEKARKWTQSAMEEGLIEAPPEE
jgi:malate dehydrogenase (oxaloacetate-decarboxylating)